MRRTAKWLGMGLVLLAGCVMPEGNGARQPEHHTAARQDATAAAVDVSTALSRVQTALPAPEWSCEQQPWTADMMRQAAGVFGFRERAEAVARTWQDGGSLIWSDRNNPPRQVGIGVVRFGEVAAARAYQGLAVDLQRRQDEVLGNPRGGAFRVLQSRSSSLKLRGADEAIRNDKRLQPSEGDVIQVSSVIARRGPLVVEFSWRGMSADPTWAQRMLDALLTDLKP